MKNTCNKSVAETTSTMLLRSQGVTSLSCQFWYKGVDNIGTWRLRCIWHQFWYMWFLQYSFGTSLCQFRYTNSNVHEC